jgi:hypothetical protein
MVFLLFKKIEFSGNWRDDVIASLFRGVEKRDLQEYVSRYSDASFQFVLKEMVRFSRDRSLSLKQIFVDVPQDWVMFFSGKQYDFFHERCVRWMIYVSLGRGFKFRRTPSRSFRDGADLELSGLNVEFESGLKRTYTSLRSRIESFSDPWIIVVPNSNVQKRYKDHFENVITLSSFPSFLDSFL